MHINFDFWDFTKSAWSLASGSFAVFLLALFRSPIDASTVILTLGLTLGVLFFWGLYALKIFVQSRNLTFFDQEQGVDPPQEGPPQQLLTFPYASPEPMPSYEPISLRIRPMKVRPQRLETVLAPDR